MSINGGYQVAFEDFAEKHYIKDYEKRYKGAWLTTRRAIFDQLRNIDMLRDSGRLRNPPIHMSEDRKKWVLKHEFAIAGLHESPHGSGRRLIAIVDETVRTVRVVLVYDKGHVQGGNETVWWEKMIKSALGGDFVSCR